MKLVTFLRPKPKTDSWARGVPKSGTLPVKTLKLRSSTASRLRREQCGSFPLRRRPKVRGSGFNAPGRGLGFGV